MRVEHHHRRRYPMVPAETCERLALEAADGIHRLHGVKGVVILGSVAKRTTVPGWSDIDLLVLLDDASTRVAALRSGLRACLDPIRAAGLGVGLDTVYQTELLSTRRFRGRPLAMAVEVSRYGWKLPGDVLEPIMPRPGDDVIFVAERAAHVDAEVQNWRRDVLSDAWDLLPPVDRMLVSAKALLRLLMREGGPLLDGPVTYERWLSAFSARCPGHPALDAFSAAIEIRSEWSRWSDEAPAATARIVDMLGRAIDEYPMPERM